MNLNYQEQIIEAAVEAAHPTLKGMDINTILNATGNPVVAAAWLLGYWSHPQTPDTTPSQFKSDSFVSFTPISYDMWKEEWKCELEEMASQSMWIPKENAKTDIPVPTVEWAMAEAKFLIEYGGDSKAVAYYGLEHTNQIERKIQFAQTLIRKREVNVNVADF